MTENDTAENDTARMACVVELAAKVSRVLDGQPLDRALGAVVVILSMGLREASPSLEVANQHLDSLVEAVRRDLAEEFKLDAENLRQ